MIDDYPWRAHPRYRAALWLQRLCCLHLTAALVLPLVRPRMAVGVLPWLGIASLPMILLMLAKAWALRGTGAPVRTSSVNVAMVSFEDGQARRWYWRDVLWLRQPQPQDVRHQG